MQAPPSAKRDRIKKFTPALVDYTNDVIYGDLWERKALSKRDRSLITVAALVATYRPSSWYRICRARSQWRHTGRDHRSHHPHGVLCGLACRDVGAQVAYTVLVEATRGMTMAMTLSSASSGSAHGARWHQHSQGRIQGGGARPAPAIAGHHCRPARWADTRARCREVRRDLHLLPEPADVERVSLGPMA